jgi:release factor glutamine methyltransferase
LLAGLAGREPFDLILSNPPYVSEAEYQSLDATVRDFEPRSALVGGAEGFELISKLIEQSEPLLAPSGRILIEMSPMLVGRQREFVPDQFSVEIVKDLANKPRVLVLGR